ncbi:hypothetical protein [Baaleninema sp.]
MSIQFKALGETRSTVRSVDDRPDFANGERRQGFRGTIARLGSPHLFQVF